MAWCGQCGAAAVFQPVNTASPSITGIHRSIDHMLWSSSAQSACFLQVTHGKCAHQPAKLLPHPNPMSPKVAHLPAHEQEFAFRKRPAMLLLSLFNFQTAGEWLTEHQQVSRCCNNKQEQHMGHRQQIWHPRLAVAGCHLVLSSHTRIITCIDTDMCMYVQVAGDSHSMHTSSHRSQL